MYETQIEGIHYKDRLKDIDFTKKLRIAVVAGDRSGPFAMDFGFIIPFFHKNTGLEFSCFDALNPLLQKDFDIIHFQRQYSPESLMILRKMRDEGKVTMALVDDNVWELPDTNPAKSTYVGATLERYQQILSEAHSYTTSTPYLKELSGRFNPNGYIFRNLVDPTIAQFRYFDRDNPEEIRIGWTLTPHHAGDAKIAMPALIEICRKYTKVKLVFMGWMPPYIPQNLPINRYEYYEFVPVDAFYACFGSLDFDIGIAPLEDNGFNWGKTARKMQEYSILRIPAVLSPVRPYDEWKDEETCLKPEGNTHTNWVKELSRMVESKELREKLQESAFNQGMENHDINTHIFERAIPYYETYEKAKGE